MKAKLLVCVVVLVGVSIILLGSLEARATVTVQAINMGYIDPGFEAYLLYGTSDDAPIAGFDYLLAEGAVHQANILYGSPPTVVFPTVLLDAVDSLLPQEMQPYDSHLLFYNDEIVLTSGFHEDNDGSNPLGMSETSPFNYGIGSLSADTFLLATPATTVEFMYVVVPADAPCSVTGEIVDTNSTPYAFEWINDSFGPSIVTDTCSLDFGNTRVGTNVQSSVGAWIEGDVVEEIYGWYSASAPFGPNGDYCWLSSDYISNVDFEFSPTSRGLFSDWGNIDANEEIASACVELSGTGVGPVFGAEQNPGTTIDFGDFAVDSFFDVFFNLSNTTEDPELGSLTQLTIEATIEGNAAGAFEILDGSLFELLVGQTDQVAIRFNTEGLATGEYEALLVLRTDVGAAVGATGNGETYTFTLRGTVVPEPSVLAGLLGLMLIGAGCGRRMDRPIS